MDYSEDALTRGVIQAVMRVHSKLGPGFLEGIYRKALLRELLLRGYAVATECEVTIYYEGEEVGTHRLDLLVEDRLIVELKAVEDLCQAHYAQVRSYLQATGMDVALLVNFAKEKADFRRIERRRPPKQT